MSEIKKKFCFVLLQNFINDFLWAPLLPSLETEKHKGGSDILKVKFIHFMLH